MKEQLDGQYRSSKAAAHAAANELFGGGAINSQALEASSPYNPERHAAVPRAIELKAPRFAYTAVFIEQVANKTLIGEGFESRLPRLQALRDRQSFLEEDNSSLEKLMDDWYEVDFSDAVIDVLCDPNNRLHLEEYQTILEDIATDPLAEESYMHTENAFDELASRIDPSKSHETEVGGYLLIKWALELMSHEAYPIPESRRQAILQSIPFIEEMGRLEIEHASKYFHSLWVYNLAQTAEEGGVEWRQDTDGVSRLRLKRREKRPEKTVGQPVGCPAGFVLENVEQPEQNSEYSAMARFLAAYVNEAYDRGLLDLL